MRIVLDTNTLVRAAADERGLAGNLLGEAVTDPHTLVTQQTEDRGVREDIELYHLLTGRPSGR